MPIGQTEIQDTTRPSLIETQEPKNPAQQLAAAHANTSTSPTGPILTDDLPLYKQIIQEAVTYFRNAAEEEIIASYAAEWLLDNDYLMIQALRMIAEDMPRSFSRKLPRLEDGLPRVYTLARVLTISSQARLDLENVSLFLQEYQRITPLTMGELWALPIMLRMIVVQVQVEAVARLTGNEGRLSSQITPRIEWPGEAGENDLVANGFISLRALAAADWKDFFETNSLVEQTLRHDPALVYERMDFETRDRYRKVVEKLAEATSRPEKAIAQAAVNLAQETLNAAEPSSFAKKSESAGGAPAHVGFYLVDRGRSRLETIVGYRPTGPERLSRLALGYPTAMYLGSIGLLSTIVLLVLTFYARWVGESLAQVILTLALTGIPVSSLAIHWVNWAITHTLPPRVLPKMDFQQGIPTEHATLVVIPALLNSQDEITSLLAQQELHYLRNPDAALFFALATDFSDAPTEHAQDDLEYIKAATEGVERLNRRYPRTDGADRFFLFHRPRRWNPEEGVWMGWERKRGKLHQLNRLVMAANRRKVISLEETAAFSVRVGRLESLPPVRYVITLDADTILPPGAARRLIAAHAHPLNRPQVNPDGRITSGYSILQPRTEIGPTSSGTSIFTRIFSGDTGLDLYTLAVSDIYQDLFGEGIFVGKGIYDIAAFEASLEGRVPENALLSHDLFEGVHGRVALATDVVLIENYPSHYLVHAGRIHRWIRGDWQLLPWLFARVPASGGLKISNPLSSISRWKILDNLRRSLVNPSLVLLLAFTWFGLLPGSPLVWTLLAVISQAGPLFTTVFSGLIHFRRRARLTDEQEFQPAGIILSIRDTFLRWLLALVFLMYEAGLAIDAIGVTLFRLLISRRNLLNWTTAAQAERRFAETSEVRTVWTKMLETQISTLVVIFGCLLLNPSAIWAAAPLVIGWLTSPLIALHISRPIHREQDALGPGEKQQLSQLARRTWLFFEQFVGPEDNWLPPDHYQEIPLGVVAHRTSPTNIGLNLLASLGSYDLGYTGLLGLSARLNSSFESLQRLERYHGHFLNWYDTRTLEPLAPAYVSTVDSGNLAACLLALSQGIQSMDGQPVLRQQTFRGIYDSLSLLEEQLHNAHGLSTWPAAKKLFQAIQSLQTQVRSIEQQPRKWTSFLLSLLEDSPRGESDTSPASFWQTVEAQLIDLAEEHALSLGAEELRRLRLFAQQARRRMENAQREISLLHPWLSLLESSPHLPPASPPELQTAWSDLVNALEETPCLGEIDTFRQEIQHRLIALRSALEPLAIENSQSLSAWCDQLVDRINQGMDALHTLRQNFQLTVAQAEAFFSDMDFSFLFNPVRQVFHIGYNLSLGRLDDNFYDLLASEARIASLVAIAKGDVPQRHWLHLSRPLTQVNDQRALLSWSATMFEYLMPSLLLHSYPHTLLDQSAAAAVDVQINYGLSKNTPWGISESGYYRFDTNQSYQYRAFGVPGLGYKRGLGEDLVIAPYASLLALPYRAKAVVKNITALKELGMRGTYGLYEAVDFTADRLPYGSGYELVREYMAHHQGMIFLAVVNHLHNDIFVRRFHADRRVQSVELLLQEQFPLDAPLEEPHMQETRSLRPIQPQVIMAPWHARIIANRPRVHMLTNGRYSTLLTAAGGGYSTVKGIDLSRWQADTTLENWGQWVYLQDLDRRQVWSISHLPTAAPALHRDVYFHPHRATYTARIEDITAEMNIIIAPEDDVEVRELDLTNHSDQPRRLRVVSYGEVILTEQANDRRHPAFNKLFIRSEWIDDPGALLFHRRVRSEKDSIVYLGHALICKDKPLAPPRYESDRRTFIGRGGSLRLPRVFSSTRGLPGTTGATLDPVYSLSQEIVIPPNGSIQLVLLTLVASTREQVLALLERFRSWSHIEITFDRARAEAEKELRRLGLHTPQLVRIQNLLSSLIFPHPRLRAPSDVLKANTLGRPGLWSLSISGDHPILLVKLSKIDEMDLAQDILVAHAYWRDRNLKVDVVFLNEQGANYGQELNAHLQRLINRTDSEPWLGRRGGIFVVSADRLNQPERILLEASARVVLDGKNGGLEKNLPGGERRQTQLPAFIPGLTEEAEPSPSSTLARPGDWLFDNGTGGFDAEGREYQIYLEAGKLAPAPWTNVIANPVFGFLTTEAGLGSTWAVNSGENRLTPWSNDPVAEITGETIYLRDEETGEIWTPTPLPSGAAQPVLVRHGFGYTTYEQDSHGMFQEMCAFAAVDAPVKIVQLKLKNQAQRVRRITITYYAEWVLGVSREEACAYIIPDFDGETQALLARNPYSDEFGERMAFAAASQRLHGLTADRAEFLGRLGDRSRPAGLVRIGLSGAVETGQDPCAALQLHVDLQPGEQQQVYFLLGQGDEREAALALVRRFQQTQEVERAWEAVSKHWKDLLSVVQVQTPDPAMDTLLNGQLLYQSLACRIWGRSAFYQSSGAYGFRDQLQDVLALLHAAPHLAREHLLHAAARQFEQGDVLHWWHPPSGRGVRTRFSDDLLWLPFVTAGYVHSTGDDSVLDEMIPFLDGPALKPDQDEHYGHFSSTAHGASLFEHCRRAIQKASTRGPHGLPLIGSGDWNDGMNRVGNEGRGESIWLAWFLIDTLNKFAAVCASRSEAILADIYRRRAKDYAQAIERHAWDGDWYLRAYYDDGAPLGSRLNRECRIDSIAQSWAVLSGAGDPERARHAMQSVIEQLVRQHDRLVLLFTPPFDRTPHDPGYIKGYPPGVRENGGQYTHAAIWTAWAFAALGDGRQAYELFAMLNPIGHAATPEAVKRYKVEPYVIAADVYGAEPHTGRGGWTWYTGSAAWMYRLGLEAILGLKRDGAFLRIEPCIPPHWPGYTIHYRHGDSVLEIQVRRDAAAQITLDGRDLPDRRIPLPEDGRRHRVMVTVAGQDTGPKPLTVADRAE